MEKPPELDEQSWWEMDNGLIYCSVSHNYAIFIDKIAKRAGRNKRVEEKFIELVFWFLDKWFVEPSVPR